MRVSKLLSGAVTLPLVAIVLPTAASAQGELVIARAIAALATCTGENDPANVLEAPASPAPSYSPSAAP